MEFLHTDRDIAVILKPVGMDSEREAPAAIAQALAAEDFDLLVTTGGTGPGERDFSLAAALRAGLHGLLGTAWDAELEPFRRAGDGAPVRWLHQVV